MHTPFSVDTQPDNAVKPAVLIGATKIFSTIAETVGIEIGGG